jgi:hypothetical protein
MNPSKAKPVCQITCVAVLAYLREQTNPSTLHQLQLLPTHDSYILMTRSRLARSLRHRTASADCPILPIGGFCAFALDRGCGSPSSADRMQASPSHLSHSSDQPIPVLASSNKNRGNMARTHCRIIASAASSKMEGEVLISWPFLHSADQHR